MSHPAETASIALVSAVTLPALFVGRQSFTRHLPRSRGAWWTSMLALSLAPVIALTVWDVAAHHYAASALLLSTLALLGSTAALVLSFRRAQVIVPASRRILVVSAHPDDLELAAGGSVARFADRGHEVHSLVMSDGSAGGDVEVRHDEALEAGRFLGLRDVALHRYTDTRLGAEMGHMIGAIEHAVATFDPHVVITHSGNDQHQDHHAVHLATLRAARRVPALLCFESPSVTPEFTPRFFVDISEYVDVKVSAVQAHADQMDKPYMSTERIEGHAAHRGAQAQVRYAEGFEVVRALSGGVGDL